MSNDNILHLKLISYCTPILSRFFLKEKVQPQPVQTLLYLNSPPQPGSEFNLQISSEEGTSHCFSLFSLHFSLLGYSRDAVKGGLMEKR